MSKLAHFIKRLLSAKNSKAKNKANRILMQIRMCKNDEIRYGLVECIDGILHCHWRSEIEKSNTGRYAEFAEMHQVAKWKIKELK